MEISIIDTDEIAAIKLNLLNKRMILVFRYISLIFIIAGTICLILGIFGGYTNHSSRDGIHTYTNYNIGLGIGIGTLITVAYLELYIWKLQRNLRKFKHSTTSYSINENGITTFSQQSKSSINWSGVTGISPYKTGFLISTNDYACPTLFFLNNQFSVEEMNWIKSQITKK